MQTEDLKGNTSELSLTDLFLSLDSEEKDSQFPVTEQAAQMIGVSQRTIEHWCEIGKLDFIRVGNRIRVWHESLKNMISTE